MRKYGQQTPRDYLWEYLMKGTEFIHFVGRKINTRAGNISLIFERAAVLFCNVHALFVRVGRRRTSSSRPTHKAWQREINWQSPRQDNFLFICRRTFKYDANPERLSLASAVKQRCPESESESESESGTRVRIEIGSSIMPWPCSSDFTLVGDDIWLFVTYIHARPA